MQELHSQLPGVSLRYSRLSDARGVMQLLGLRDVTEDGMPTTALLRSAKVQCLEDVVDLIQTSFLCVSAVDTVPASLSSDAEGAEAAEATTAWTGSARGPHDGSTGGTERVVGFVALGTGPRVYGEAVANSTPRGSTIEVADAAPPASDATLFPPDRWEDIVHSGVYAGQEVDTIWPSNTLWASVFVAPSSDTVAEHLPSAPAVKDKSGGSGGAATPAPYTAARLLQELLAVALSASPRTSHILWPLPPVSSSSTVSDLLKEALSAQELPSGLSAVKPAGFDFKGSLMHIRREDVIPALSIRAGRIEDYDDFAPLLVRGAGVVTELPEDLFLEEVLKDQNASNKVCVAENAVTHEVVALACAHVLSPEEQLYFTKQYSLEAFNKLRPTVVATRERDSPAGVGSGGGGTVRLDFVFFDDAYNGSAHEFVNYIFEKMFPKCDYLLITLPHAQPETPLLRSFIHLPIRQYRPHNSRGEYAPVPPGLWVCSRLSTLRVEQFRATAVRAAEERALAEEFLRLPSLYDLKNDVAEKLREDLCISHEKYKIEGRAPTMRLPSTTVFQLTMAGGETIGLVSARRMEGKELYALKMNYDMDEYISLYTHTGKDYSATNVAQTKAARLPPELSGVVLRGMYVKPAYRTWVRFLVREVLRLFVADVACVLTPLEEEAFPPLLQELILARPRRVVEKDSEATSPTDDVPDAAEGGGAAAAADAASTSTEPTGEEAMLASLHFTTPRYLGDEKQRVNARLVVVGASATGLSFLHALLATPFARFTNLVLVSTDGLPLHPNQEPTLWRADHMELMERDYLALQQGSPFRVVSGALVDLDKVNRFISVDNGTFEPYDYLVLTAGRQYVLPPSVRQLLQQEGRTGKKSVIALNGELALDRVRQSLAEIDVNTSNVANVMVYGSGLDALAVAAAMVEENFSAQRVVVCARDTALPAFLDEATYQATSTLFRAMGINVFRGYDVSRMEFDDENNLSNVLLAPVSPESKAGQSVELACCLVICLEDKDIDANVLSALNKRSIVFDGRVIVNRRYRTTDPGVFAAGPVAMWTRRYGTNTPNFEDFKANDVGQHLAQVVLGQLGFEEFRSLAARSGRRALMDRLLGSTRRHQAEGLGDDSESDGLGDLSDEEADGSWNDAAQRPARPAASAAGLDLPLGEAPEDTVNGSTSKRMSFRSNQGGTVKDQSRGDVNAQLRKKLPSYITPLARRVRLPGGYHLFSVQAVEAKLLETCDALTCNTIDTEKFSFVSGDMLSPKGDKVEKGEEATKGAMTSGSSPQRNARRRSSASECAVFRDGRGAPSDQSVVTLYVNRGTRRIDGVTYFGLAEPPTGNLTALVGLPETVLNLVFRYREAQQRVAAHLVTANGAPTDKDSVGDEGAAAATMDVDLPAHSALTAGVRRGQLDLMQYLRLPHLETVFYDRFTDFFRLLERRSRAHEEAVKARERILAQHKLDSSLSPEHIALYQAELTEQRSRFRYEVQLALLTFLHEQKNFRPHNMYLPNVERVVTKKCAASVDGTNGMTRDPIQTVR